MNTLDFFHVADFLDEKDSLEAAAELRNDHWWGASYPLGKVYAAGHGVGIGVLTVLLEDLQGLPPF